MRKRFIISFLTAACLIMTLAGCSGSESGSKIVVTMSYDEKLTNTEAFIEDKLPNVDFQWQILTGYLFVSTMQRQIETGHAPDLVISNQPADEDSSNYMLALDGYEFSSRYESTMLKDLTVDERLYYLPKPGQYSCYIINKTLLDQANLEIPKNNEELISTLITLQEAGIGLTDTGHPFGMRKIDNITTGTLLMGSLIPDFLGTTQGVTWMAEYENKETTMAGYWEPGFDILDELVKNDLISTLPFSKQGNQINMADYMSQGRLAMAYGSSAFYKECKILNEEYVKEGTTEPYEYVMVPFLSNESAPCWTLSRPTNYLGINGDLEKNGLDAKLEACIEILDILSTKEGQEALMKDLRLDNSYLKDFESEASTIPRGLEETVENGYVYYVKFPGKITEYLGSQVALFLGGKKTAEECLAAVDDYYINGSAVAEEDLTIYG
ncbi:MAG: ABC transporter substrate-binding protein, partial [Bacillota bacterium]|nr:ABC transporter substrate-binding protein [Bacillota bacterium]